MCKCWTQSQKEALFSVFDSNAEVLYNLVSLQKPHISHLICLCLNYLTAGVFYIRRIIILEERETINHDYITQVQGSC